MVEPGDDFEIGKKVFEELKGLPAERQTRILRWVSEGLNLAATPSPIVSAAPAVLPAAAIPASTQLPAGASVDIKTFIASKAPKSDMQFAASVAYYYRFEAPVGQRKESITAEILQEAARLAGRHRLTNPLKTLNNAKGGGYLDGAARGEFAINSVGENLVAMTLPGGPGAVPARKATKPAKKSPKKK